MAKRVNMYLENVLCDCNGSASQDFKFYGITLESFPQYQCRICGGVYINSGYDVSLNSVPVTSYKPSQRDVVEMFYDFDRVKWSDILIFLHNEDIDNRACYYAIFSLDGKWMCAEYVTNDRDSLAQHNLSREAKEFDYTDTLKRMTRYRTSIDDENNPIVVDLIELIKRVMSERFMPDGVRDAVVNIFEQPQGSPTETGAVSPQEIRPDELISSESRFAE